MDRGDSDHELRRLFASDPAEGWRVFIERYTPHLLSVIQHAGVLRQDDVMDVYLRVCEHLAADDCATLRRYDPDRGALPAWLTVVTRRAVVDWLRSRHGRRRLFKGIQRLGALEQRVFELRYWDRRPATEIAEVIGSETGASVSLADVFDALERVDGEMSSRQRGELLSSLARERRPMSLDDDERPIRAQSAETSVEERLQATESGRALSAALARLPAEDALIAVLLYVDGVSRAEVERILGLPSLSFDRTRRILAQLRSTLGELGVGRERS